jgi:hypothetical protein
VALPLVLEKICSSPWGWEATTTHIMEWEEIRCIYDRMCRFWTKLQVMEQSEAIQHQTDLTKFWWSRMALEHGDMKKIELVMKQPNKTSQPKLYMQIHSESWAYSCMEIEGGTSYVFVPYLLAQWFSRDSAPHFFPQCFCFLKVSTAVTAIKTSIDTAELWS